MAGPIRISILANASQARREMNSFSTTMGKIGRVAAAAGIVAGGALVKFGVDAVKSASDAQQSIGATEKVYGKFAERVVANSEKAADALGLSANEYREIANVTGAMLKSSGMPLQKVTGLTEDLTERAADLAATYGGTTKDAIAAVGSLLRGEADPIEQYGVSIKQSDVAARLAAKGLDKLEGSAKKQAEQQARVDLLFRQTTDSAGQFADEAETLAGQQQRLTAEFENVRAEIGTALLPILTDLAKWARDEVVPALEDFSRWLNNNSDEISRTAGAIKNTLVPPLQVLGDLIVSVTKFFASLPGPVKKFAAEAAVLAVVLPKVTRAMQAAQLQGALFVGSMKDSTKRTAMLGKAMRNVAGIGGTIALTEGLADNENSLGSWSKAVGGGALAGAALGSVIPGVGTVIGGLGGAAFGAGGKLVGLALASDDAAESAVQAEPKYDDWASTLDQVSGAATRATRSLVLQKLQQENLIGTAAQLGIDTRDLIGATLGHEGAMKRVNKAAKGNTDILRAMEHQNLSDFIYENNNALEKQQGALRQNNSDLQTWSQALRGIPKEVKTRLRQLDYEPTMKQVKNLQKQYDLTPEQVKTIIKEVGVGPVQKKVEGLQKNLKGLGDVKPSDEWLDLFGVDIESGKVQSRKGAEGMAQNLEEGTGKARPNLNPFKALFAADITSLKGTASSGGSGIGSNMGSGINSGIGGWAQSIANTAASVVSRAIAAAKRQAKVKSPSRVTTKIGSQIGEGFVVGLRKKQRRAQSAARRFMLRLIKGFDDGSQGVGKFMDRLTRKIEKALGDNAKRIREWTKRLKKMDDALVKNSRRQDKNTRRLDAARDAYKALTQEAKNYAQAVKDSVVGSGNVTLLGQNEDGSTSIGGLIDQLKDKVNAAKRYASLIRDLTAQGLNKTTLQQIIDAGVEGGLGTAEAIASGGQAALAEINALTADLTSTGSSLGESTRATMYDAGLQAAQGLIDGLEAKAAKLDKAAKRMALSIARAVKKALGIKSPSRVFKDIGGNVTKGLEIGLDDTYVKRSGAVLASSLQKGFGTPALDAYASQQAAAGQGSIRVTLAAEQVSALQRGREIQMDLDTYRASGGRVKP